MTTQNDKFAFFSITNVFSYLGALIITIGLFILIQDYWLNFTELTKISLTFGVGIVLLIIANILSLLSRSISLAGACYLISAVTISIGLHIIVYVNGYDLLRLTTQMLLAFILFITYYLLSLNYRRAMLSFISIAFATWLIICVLIWLSQRLFFYIPPLYTANYVTLLIGILYILLGWRYANTSSQMLTPFLYSIGSAACLFAAMNNSSWLFLVSYYATHYPLHTIIWNFLAPIIAIIIISCSILLKSKSMLTFGTLFLMFYIIRAADRYFQATLGWPISLIIIGIGLIAVGYGAVWLRRRFM